MLLASFVFAYLGEERAHYFTADERELAAWLAESATPNTLLIEGSRNYPGMSRNEERFTFRPLSRESADVISRLDADPERTLYDWMSDEEFESSYFIVTRSMRNEQRSVPSMPAGSLPRIEAAIASSERFRVVRSNRDGAVYVLAGGG